MDIKSRAKNIIVSPASEWPVIAEEQTEASTLITSYVAPLAAIGAIAGFIGGSLVGVGVPFLGTYRVPIVSGLTMAIFTFVMAIVGVLIVAFIVNALAPTFGAEKNSSQALKVAVYSYTPAWIAGVFNILPTLGILGLLAAFYGIYLLYLGLPPLMKAPQEKAVGYTAVVVVCAIVLTIVVSAVGGIFMAPAAIAGLGAGSAETAQADPDTPLGKLEALGRSMEQSAAKMDAAEKSGDTNAQTAAAFEALGTLFGGGKRVDPVAIDQLTPLVPASFAGLAKRSSDAQRAGMAGIMVATAEATYGDAAGKSASLEITDTGGASGLMSLAQWGVGERETDSVSEKTEQVGGRLVHQSVSKTGGTNEFVVVVAERFIVTAKGNIGIDALKGAVSDLDLGKLDALAK